MNKKQSRRKFVQKSSRIGLACAAFAFCPHIDSFGNMFQNNVTDPKKLNYCGYVCPPDCQMYIATLENDNEKKLEAFKLWRLKEKYGIEFDAEKIYCYGCKIQDKPVGFNVSRCTVRTCASSKGYDCCIECNDLVSCEFEIWKTFPEFHKQVIEMQKKFIEAKENA